MLLVAVGTGCVDGPLAIAALFVVLVAIVALIIVASWAVPTPAGQLAPYGLLKPGILWLALFFLAPLFTLLRNSLSTQPSRFDFEADFDWHFGNYADALTDFRDQFERAFLYAGIATVLTIAHRLPAGLRDRLPRRALPELPDRAGHHPVLHVVPHPHDRLAEHAGRRGAVTELPATITSTASWTRSASWTATSC